MARGHGEGSIGRRKDGRWEARIRLPGGTRQSFYGKTRQEVQQQLIDAAKSRQDGVAVPSNRLTLGSFVESWAPSAQSQVRENTWIRYEGALRVHILPELGRVRLTRLSPLDLKRFYERKLEQGQSASSVLKLARLLHRIIRDAMQWGYVYRNVTELVRPPSVRRREMQTWTAEQSITFLKTAKPDRLHALYVVALTTGMRQGELLALRWKDVDLKGGWIRVTASIQARGSKFVEPKSAKSRRRVQLGDMAIDALRDHREKQDKERELLGSRWTDLDLVFANTVGRVHQASDFLRNHYKPLRDKSGVPPIRFHDLRHTAATLMLLQGVHPKIVQEMLGHSTISITMDQYSHVTETMQKDAAERVNKIFAA